MSGDAAGLTVLIADADAESGERFSRLLRAAGNAVQTVATGAELLSVSDRQPFDCAIVDLDLPDADGLAMLRRLRAKRPTMTIVALSASPRVETAAAAFAAGADDYLAKKFAGEELAPSLDRAVRHARFGADADGAGPGLRQAVPEGGLLIGSSARMVAVYKLIARTADLPTTVLITGETGSGKEQVARAIHTTGRRAAHPFLAVDCASIPENLFESEFFGHERGAFTGAHAVHRGVLEAAGEGTCFLDEIGELPLHLQAKLLRALQERQIRRVGSTRTIPISARIICATNRDLAEYVQRGAFREDLYYRLNVVPIHLPPLRERPEDIRALVEHFVARYSEARPGGCRMSAEALDILLRYPWPGNVRQLENVIERTVALTPYPALLPEDLPPEILEADRLAKTMGKAAALQAGDPVALRELTRIHIDEVLKKTGGNKLRAAQMLGIDRRTLYRILQRNSPAESTDPPHEAQ